MNFFELFLCGLNGNLYIMIPIVILSLFFIFKFICALVDEYIAAAIDYIVNRYKIGEAIAGVTLIALANGAGDVVTAIVASGSADGVAYNIGALFGAGLFVCTIVMTFTITGYKDPEKEGKWGPITVSKNTIYRDMPFYIVTVLFVVFCGIYGEITWWTSSIMLFIYVALVIVVYIQGRNEEKTKEKEPASPMKKNGEVELTNKDDGASKPLLGGLSALKQASAD